MNELVLVALLSSAGAAIVGLSSAAATIFGPAWRERGQRISEQKSVESGVRYAQALEFVDALSQAALNNYWHETVALHMTRTRFVATLRAGEQPMVRYSAAAIMWVRAGENAEVQLRRADEAGELIFGWLRGDVTVSGIKDSLESMLVVIQRTKGGSPE